MNLSELPPAIVASVSALLGVIIATLAQWLFHKRQIAMEERKARLSLITTFADKLEERRLEAYSEICQRLSDAVKHIDYPEMFPAPLDLIELEVSITRLDSKHSILFSSISGDSAWKLRAHLRRLIRQNDRLPESPNHESWANSLRASLVALEVSLRIDLGVYAWEFTPEINCAHMRYNPDKDPMTLGTIDK